MGKYNAHILNMGFGDSSCNDPAKAEREEREIYASANLVRGAGRADSDPGSMCAVMPMVRCWRL
jgi:hypothetical protein